ncbi:MAG: hypothetical protein ACF8AM_15685 [Rhodopirellula sp. JB055]|uniref:hypothetical protein n=1 Tax=Rhodopirellula sp. JB055 TaxID=3342846 RepID=UPI00370ACF58
MIAPNQTASRWQCQLWIAGLILHLGSISPAVFAQSNSQADLAAEGMIDEEQWVAEPIAMSALPVPEEAIAELLESGQVEFISGGPRPSVAAGLRSTGFINREFDAETRFNLSYHFVSRCRWWWSDDGIVVKVRYPELKLKVDHKVWFRRRPNDLSRFWDSPLVQHEMDHIRLSTDPRVLSRFESAVREDESLRFSSSEIRSVLGENVVLNRNATPNANNRTSRNNRSSGLSSDQVRKLINQRVRAHFQQTVELIEIRYRELDRQTAHGSFAVPDTGPLRQWLDHSSSDLADATSPDLLSR